MNYHLRGFGTVAPPNYESCGFDMACIARNVALQGQYQEALLRDQWATNNPGIPYPNYQYDANGVLIGTSPGTPVAVQAPQQTSYVASQPVVKVDDTKVVPGSQTPPTSGGIWTEDTSTGPVWTGAVEPVPTPAVSDATQTPATTGVFAGFPIWAWALAGVGVALFAFGGGRGR